MTTPIRTRERGHQTYLLSCCPPRRVEYGSDLHWLCGWGDRLGSYLDSDPLPSSLDWMIFRPDSLARDAMARFSTTYPLVIKQVDDYLDSADRQFRVFCDNPNDSTSASFAEAMLNLRERIRTAVDVIAEHEAPAAPAADKVTWQEAQERLTRLQQQGEPYTDQRELATKLGCSPATISKAISSSKELNRWMGQKKGRQSSPPATGLTRFVLDNTPQQSEPDPSDLWETADTDKTLEYLINEQPEGQRDKARKELEAMSPDQRDQLAKVADKYRDDAGKIQKKP